MDFKTNPGRNGGKRALLEAYQAIVGAQAPVFIVKNGDVAWQGDIEELSALRLVSVADSDDGQPRLEAGFAMSQMNWAAVMDQVTAAISHEHFLNTPGELVRVFATAVRQAAKQAASGLNGDPLPLLLAERSARDEGISIRFLGIWLADEAAKAALDDDSCILFDQEAEGRGLRELLVSAAILAMVLPGTATAGDGAQNGRQKTSWLTSLFSGGEKGEVMKVKSQRLVQAPPRIYRSVLDSPAAGGTRVVVDIGDQRAYLLKGGQVAFETPISTGQGCSWTPRGTFTITEKVKSGKISTIYNCPLPGWMRIGDTKVGMHEGMLPGYPASHGCIRMPIESAYLIFDHAPRGTTVQIVDSWSPPNAQPQGTMLAQN